MQAGVEHFNELGAESGWGRSRRILEPIFGRRNTGRTIIPARGESEVCLMWPRGAW